MVRIASLLASGTEIVHALGLGTQQVLRSHECDYPETVRALPCCTAPRFSVEGNSLEIDRLVKDSVQDAASIYHIDTDLLAQHQPTHIITQAQCRVCAVSLQDVERVLQQQAHLADRPRVISLEPNSLSDLWSDILSVAYACHAQEQGLALVRRLQDRMDVIAERSRQARSRPRVACLEWVAPLMAGGNWVPELVELAGGENLFGQAGIHSPWMAWNSLVSADPDVIIALPCGFDLQRTRAESYWLTEHPAWPDLRAVRQGQVFLTDGNQYFNRSGPRLVESLQILAEILHPDLFPPVHEGSAWMRLSAASAT